MTSINETRLEVHEVDREMIRLLTTLNQTKQAIVKGFVLGLRADSTKAERDSA